MSAKRISVGDQVGFTTNTGQHARGTVVDLIVEKRQPTIVLIEKPDGGRAFRLEHEVRLFESAVLAGVES